jgi:hypothetical protein
MSVMRELRGVRRAHCALKKKTSGLRQLHPIRQRSITTSLCGWEQQTNTLPAHLEPINADVMRGPPRPLRARGPYLSSTDTSRDSESTDAMMRSSQVAATASRLRSKV